jgi:hypothetical protein
MFLSWYEVATNKWQWALFFLLCDCLAFLLGHLLLEFEVYDQVLGV